MLNNEELEQNIYNLTLKLLSNPFGDNGEKDENYIYFYKAMEKTVKSYSKELSKIITEYIKNQDITITVTPEEVIGTSTIAGPVTIQGVITKVNIQ